MTLADKIRRFISAVIGRKRDYELTFHSPAGQRVLADFAKFCRANESCFDEDPRVHAALEGRREVWLRIQQHLNLSASQLAELYGGRQFKVVKEEENA